MNGLEVVESLKRKFRVSTDRELGTKIGMAIPGIQVWKNRTKVTARQMAEMVSKAHNAGARHSENNAVRPVVEFFPVQPDLSPQGASYVIFNVNNGATKNKYLKGLRDELDSTCGVYIFFDSRGQAIYTGKARKQTLWREMNLAFNRERGEVQKIKRVKHPTRNQPYKTSDEKSRQIVDQVVPLHEIAAYFSAYKISDGMIGEVEAMLVRSFANDLLNVRMERFVQQRKPK